MVETELQADCFAGEFCNHARTAGRLDAGNLDEALAMTYVGGDNRSLLDSRAHGSPKLRVQAFLNGYNGEASCWDYTPL